MYFEVQPLLKACLKLYSTYFELQPCHEVRLGRGISTYAYLKLDSSIPMLGREVTCKITLPTRGSAQPVLSRFAGRTADAQIEFHIFPKNPLL